LTGSRDYYRCRNGAGRGSNNPAQDRALAIRAARTDAQRVLLETVKVSGSIPRPGGHDDGYRRCHQCTGGGDRQGAQLVKQDIQWITGDDGKKYPAATMELRLCLNSVSHGCKSAKSLISARIWMKRNCPTTPRSSNSHSAGGCSAASARAYRAGSSAAASASAGTAEGISSRHRSHQAGHGGDHQSGRPLL